MRVFKPLSSQLGQLSSIRNHLFISPQRSSVSLKVSAIILLEYLISLLPFLFHIFNYNFINALVCASFKHFYHTNSLSKSKSTANHIIDTPIVKRYYVLSLFNYSNNQKYLIKKKHQGFYSTKKNDDDTNTNSHWRKTQLSKLTLKFEPQLSSTTESNQVVNKKNISNDNNNSASCSEDGRNNKNNMIKSTVKKFNSDDGTPKNDNEDEVQQMWLDMESRVTKRKSMTIQQAAKSGKGVGRRNIRRTEEDAWLEAGVYGDGLSKNK